MKTKKMLPRVRQGKGNDEIPRGRAYVGKKKFAK